MAMVTGYFDDSGHPDQGIAVAVAGYVSSVEDWQLFEYEWKAALSAEGISVFHMKEFAHSQGDFADWKGDYKRRREFLEKLARIIAKRARKSISSVLMLDEYHRADQIYQIHEWSPPYAFCGAACALKSRQWMKRRKHEGIEYVFEKGAKHHGKLMELMELEGLPAPIFKEKKDFGALQAADFVAWEHLKHLTEAEAGTLRRYRKSFQALQCVPQDWGVVAGGRLLKNCQACKIPKRASDAIF